MAGLTSITQELADVSTTTNYLTEVTQLLVVGSVTLSYKTLLTQTFAGVSTWTNYRTEISQNFVDVWVLRCDSTSYVAPAPTGLLTLTATPGTTGQQWIDLAWNAVPGMTYTLQRGLSSGVYNTTLLSGSSAVSLHDTGVSFNTQYFYLLTGTNACSDTTTSNEATAAPGCTLPDVPLRLHATANNTTGAIDLVWNAASGATSYDVWRGTSPGSETLLASGVVAASYSDSTAVGGTLYYYTIFAVNACGLSTASNEVSAQTSCCTRWASDTPCSTDFVSDEDCSTSWTSDGC